MRRIGDDAVRQRVAIGVGRGQGDGLGGVLGGRDALVAGDGRGVAAADAQGGDFGIAQRAVIDAQVVHHAREISA